MSFKRDIVIGLEIHIELDTDTKLFCGCPTRGGNSPNSRTCEVCLGMPGSKPVLNRKAVDFGTKIALAMGCEIAPELVFSRKSYFYPDLAKNYQITQYELPLGSRGSITLPDGKKIDITRIHIEEDPAALVHPSSMTASSHVLVDYNRSGSPLCEIVTEPDIDSPEQAREFMKQLLNLLNYLGVYHKDGTIKADCNVSIREGGYTRSEIKNVTGFKEIERALKAEVERQEQAVSEGEKLIQDTRGWDPALGTTFRMRTKETEADYGYILDPDLAMISLPKEYVTKVQDALPELPRKKAEKFIRKYKISKEDAYILAAERTMAELFEEVAESHDPQFAVRWLRHELNRLLNLHNRIFGDVRASPQQIIRLLDFVAEKKVTDATGRELLEKLLESPFDVVARIRDEGLEAVSDSNELAGWCQKVIDENRTVVKEFKSGKEKALNFLMGKVMQVSKGKADPGEVLRILKRIIV